MRLATIRNLTRPSFHAIRVQYCDTFWTKFKGLMFRRGLVDNSGVLLAENRDSILNTSIHMFFMFFDIAVVWINSQNTVVDKKIAHKGHPSYVPSKPARYVLEAPISAISSFEVDDHVSIEID